MLKLVNLCRVLVKRGGIQEQVDGLDRAALGNINALGVAQVRDALDMLALEADDGSSSLGPKLLFQQAEISV